MGLRMWMRQSERRGFDAELLGGLARGGGRDQVATLTGGGRAQERRNRLGRP